MGRIYTASYMILDIIGLVGGWAGINEM